MGIGWDKDAAPGRPAPGAPEIDLDATALQFTGRQLFDLAFYNNLKTRDGSVEHLGDNLTGSGEGDDEQITVDLARVHGPVDTIVLLVSSYQGHSLEWVANAYCRLVDDETDEELARFTAHLRRQETGCGAGAPAAYAVRVGAARRSARACDHGADAGAGEADPASCPSAGHGTSREQEHDGLGHAGRLGLALDLDRVADDELLAGRDVGELGQRGVAADAAPTLTGLGNRTLLRP